MPRKPRIDWQTAPTIFVVIATCPVCGDRRHDTRRSCSNGDGTVTRLVVCRGCGLPFKVVAEFPDYGNLDDGFGKIQQSKSEDQL